jgi:hypothetical protein
LAEFWLWFLQFPVSPLCTHRKGLLWNDVRFYDKSTYHVSLSVMIIVFHVKSFILKSLGNCKMYVALGKDIVFTKH